MIGTAASCGTWQAKSFHPIIQDRALSPLYRRELPLRRLLSSLQLAIIARSVLGFFWDFSCLSCSLAAQHPSQRRPPLSRSGISVAHSPKLPRHTSTSARSGPRPPGIMASPTLLKLSRAEVESHNSKKSLYVTLGNKVYDVTDFADDHPGGAELILEYGGKDIGEILKDDASHEHSDTAYEVLDECLVGFLVKETANGANGKAAQSNGDANGEAGLKDEDGREIHPRTGMSCEEDLSKETDYTSDYKTHKFLDLSRPLFPQVWFGGFSKEFYLDQVHRPRHYRGGQSAPLFGNFLEPLTKTPWWLIPTIWLPPVIYGTYLARQGLGSNLELAAYWVFGLFLWTFLEYCLHRFLFHLDG